MTDDNDTHDDDAETVSTVVPKPDKKQAATITGATKAKSGTHPTQVGVPPQA